MQNSKVKPTPLKPKKLMRKGKPKEKEVVDWMGNKFSVLKRECKKE